MELQHYGRSLLNHRPDSTASTAKWAVFLVYSPLQWAGSALAEHCAAMTSGSAGVALMNVGLCHVTYGAPSKSFLHMDAQTKQKLSTLTSLLDSDVFAYNCYYCSANALPAHYNGHMLTVHKNNCKHCTGQNKARQPCKPVLSSQDV